ncbi:MAG: hypothetical protein M1830_001377 [Pleopsidium flavum]|nr:MAG: hypothetical protein M1830_001377 [Pleopsidium flavum]
MPSTTLPTLAEDQLDDILYFARVGDFTELRSAIETSAKQVNVPLRDILLAAVDEPSGNGPLHMASANGHTGPPIIQRIFARVRLIVVAEILNYVLSLLPRPPARTLLSLQNISGNTALHWASLNGHLGAVKLLVQAGADPGITNKAGHDAVYEAEVNGKDDVVEWLLTEGKGLDAGVEGGSEDEVKEKNGMDELQEEVEGMHVGEKAD